MFYIFNQEKQILSCCFSHSVVSDSFVTQWTVALQAPLSVGFPRQVYCSGWPFPSPEDLSNPGIEPVSPVLQVDSLPLSIYTIKRYLKEGYDWLIDWLADGAV